MTQAPSTTNLHDRLASWIASDPRIVEMRALFEEAENAAVLCVNALHSNTLSPAQRADIIANAHDVAAKVSAACRRPAPPLPPLDALFSTRAEAARKPRRSIKAKPEPSPDGLRTAVEAARKLRCSVKTLNGHVASGALRYVSIGHGKKRPRKMFADADIDAFIANQTRKAAPCPSTARRARHTGTSTSSGEVIAFTAQPRPQTSVKRKR